MKISKTIEIDMGHRLPDHKSKCRNLHGHRYVFEAIIDGEPIIKKGDPAAGMITDFSNLKKIMMDVIDTPLDHGFMIYEKDPLLALFETMQRSEGLKIKIVTFIPTVENIAKDIFKKLQTVLWDYAINLVCLKVWETPTSMAITTNEDFK